MKKNDFTIKGTKLPTIPKGTKYRVGIRESTYEFSETLIDLYSKGSYGNIILADYKGFNCKYCYQIPLSTIERLAQEQGMLYEKETERDWTGVRFRWEDGKMVNTIVKEKGVYNYGERFNYTQEEVDLFFANGTWIEVKEEPNPITEQLLFSFAPSLRDLLENACAHERNIRKVCPMWKGVDENERLEQVKQEWSKLGEVVAVLHKQLNEKK